IGENITLDQKDSITIISISNNLGYDTADELRSAYQEVETDDVLVDLGQVSVTTSRGMATLLSIIVEGQEEDQQFCLCNVSEACMLIIDAMNIMEYVEGLEIVDSMEEGIALFSS
ncbi:MAG: STAS domain-containing protein, partial [Candidatus Poribacteria bacterium]|nr:STAS domain-containing protein [Candidatus Poribacteria bacterium]